MIHPHDTKAPPKTTDPAVPLNATLTGTHGQNGCVDGQAGVPGCEGVMGSNALPSSVPVPPSPL